MHMQSYVTPMHFQHEIAGLDWYSVLNSVMQLHVCCHNYCGSTELGSILSCPRNLNSLLPSFHSKQTLPSFWIGHLASI